MGDYITTLFINQLEYQPSDTPPARHPEYEQFLDFARRQQKRLQPLGTAALAEGIIMRIPDQADDTADGTLSVVFECECELGYVASADGQESMRFRMFCEKTTVDGCLDQIVGSEEQLSPSGAAVVQFVLERAHQE